MKFLERFRQKEEKTEAMSDEAFRIFKEMGREKLKKRLKETDYKLLKLKDKDKIFDSQENIVGEPFEEIYLAGDIIVANTESKRFLFSPETLKKIVPKFPEVKAKPGWSKTKFIEKKNESFGNFFKGGIVDGQIIEEEDKKTGRLSRKLFLTYRDEKKEEYPISNTTEE